MLLIETAQLQPSAVLLMLRKALRFSCTTYLLHPCVVLLCCSLNSAPAYGSKEECSLARAAAKPSEELPPLPTVKHIRR
jgi:hypothetical protein